MNLRARSFVASVPRAPGRVLRAAVLPALLAVIASVVTPSAVAAAAPGTGAGTSPGQDAIPVIIELDVAYMPPGLLTAAQEQTQQDRVDDVRDQVAEALEGHDAQVTAEFTLVPYLAASVDAAELEAIEQLDGVRSVVVDELAEPLLDTSTVTIGAADPSASFLATELDGQGQAIAIIDTGIEADHPFFLRDASTSRVIAEACFARGADGRLDTEGSCPDKGTSQLGPGSAAPLGDHGTHVAGIAAGGLLEPGSPAQGVAPGADLVVAQTFNLFDDDSRRTYVSDLVLALEWVHGLATGDEEVDPISIAAVNLSLGAPAPDGCNPTGSWNAFEAAVGALRDAEVLTIAAAGNGGSRTQIGHPACLPNVASVGATTAGDTIASFSDLSDNTDLVAPGVLIRSAILDGGFGFKSGTSMAAPHAAGAAALLRQASPGLSADDLLAALSTSRTMVNDQRVDGEVEQLPRLDVPAALVSLPGLAGAPGAPAAVTATVDSTDNALAVSWSEVDAADSYVAIAQPGGATCTATSAQTDCVLTGLTAGVGHRVTVRAVGSEGFGPSSGESDEAIPLSRPSPPTVTSVTPGANQVTVAWTAPASDGGTPLTGYEVQLSTDTGQTWQPAGSVASSTTSTTVTGLTNGTPYTFTVSATNARGAGDPSAPSSPVTPGAPPGSPTAVTAVAGDGQAEVSWTAPLDDGGLALTGYTVTASPGAQTCTPDPATATTCTVTGLTNGTAHTFTVTAANERGAGQPSAPSEPVVPTGPPEPPVSVSAQAGARSATVSWSPPDSDGGATITSYAVQTVSGSQTCTPVPDTATTCTVTGLTNGTPYTFTVTATNDNGTSPPSAPSNETIPVSVPASPTAVTTVAGNGAVTVSWTPPTDTGGLELTGFTATATPGDAFCTATADATSCTVTGLTNGSEYTFTVTASNDQGVSEPSASSSATPMAVVPAPPTGVSATRGNSLAIVSWTPPSDDGGSPLTGYEVRLSTDTGQTWQPAGSVGPSTTSTTVTGLTNGTAYTFIVTATNAQGASVPSSASNAVTPATVPGAPTSVTAVAADARATVSWTAPQSNGGSPVTSYQVTSAPGGRTCSTSGSPPATSCAVTGLTNGTAYTFTVIARNAVGDSAASTPSPAVTPTAPPAPPPPPPGGGGGGGGGEPAPPPTQDPPPADDPTPAPDPEPDTQPDPEPVAPSDPPSDAEPSTPPAPGPDSPATSANGTPVTAPAGSSIALVDGQPTTATTRVDSDSVQIHVAGITLDLTPTDADGNPTSRLAQGTMSLAHGDQVHLTLDGARPTSTAAVWLLSDPLRLAAPQTSIQGSINTRVTIPTDTDLGNHTLQVIAETPTGASVTIALGIVVDEGLAGFLDVNIEAAHGHAILRLVGLGITTGYDDGTFRPAEAVTRGQMATFLQRGLDLTLSDQPGPFSDTAGTTHGAAIHAVAAANIAGGFPDGTYRPGAPVTRGQMATFLANAAALDIEAAAQAATDAAQAGDQPAFRDVIGTTHGAAILAVADAGIAQGFSDGAFRPGEQITRAQMASFLIRMLDYLDNLDNLDDLDDLAS